MVDLDRPLHLLPRALQRETLVDAVASLDALRRYGADAATLWKDPGVEGAPPPKGKPTREARAAESAKAAALVAGDQAAVARERELNALKVRGWATRRTIFK